MSKLRREANVYCLTADLLGYGMVGCNSGIRLYA